MSRIALEKLKPEEVPWDVLDGFGDHTVYQTKPWLDFVVETQGAEPVIAAVREGAETIGYFTGLTVTKMGLRVLGSPFKGWTTAYQGFNLPPGMPRGELLDELPSFAFDELGCHYLELVDRYLTDDDVKGRSYGVQHFRGYEIDLTKSEDELFAAMKGACRRCVRKARKSGVEIEEARDEGFADEYYEQLLDVFAKQSLVPTYDVERIRSLIRHLMPTGNLLLLRARDPEGRCIATGIYPGYNDAMYFFGGASWRAHQILRPNEAVMWRAMLTWKERGIRTFDMGGSGDYKAKYGGYEISVPRLMKAKYPGLIRLRELALGAWRLRQKLSGGLRGGRPGG